MSDYDVFKAFSNAETLALNLFLGKKKQTFERLKDVGINLSQIEFEVWLKSVTQSFHEDGLLPKEVDITKVKYDELAAYWIKEAEKHEQDN